MKTPTVSPLVRPILHAARVLLDPFTLADTPPAGEARLTRAIFLWTLAALEGADRTRELADWCQCTVGEIQGVGHVVQRGDDVAGLRATVLDKVQGIGLVLTCMYSDDPEHSRNAINELCEELVKALAKLAAKASR